MKISRKASRRKYSRSKSCYDVKRIVCGKACNGIGKAIMPKIDGLLNEAFFSAPTLAEIWDGSDDIHVRIESYIWNMLRRA